MFECMQSKIEQKCAEKSVTTCVHIIGNFDVTEEEEITLKGFLALHEMSAADEEGGEEEVWQVLKALGYDRQLHLNQVCSSYL